MDDMETTLHRIEATQAEPGWGDKVRLEEERLAREGRKAIGAARRAAVEKLALPEKHLELVGAGQLDRTMATEALATPPLLTVLSGGPGTGKTTAAVSWLHGWVWDEKSWRVEATGFEAKAFFRYPPGMFITAARLARWARYDEKRMEEILRAGRLVIDDLGAEFLDQKGSFMALFDEVVNERYAGKRPTVLTTNLGMDDFKARYEGRVEDRIREVGKFVALGNESMRRRVEGPRQPTLSAVRAPSHDPRLPPEPDDDEPQREIVP